MKFTKHPLLLAAAFAAVTLLTIGVNPPAQAQAQEGRILIGVECEEIKLKWKIGAQTGTVEDTDYPYEVSVPAGQTEFSFSVSGAKADGSAWVDSRSQDRHRPVRRSQDFIDPWIPRQQSGWIPAISHRAAGPWTGNTSI